MRYALTNEEKNLLLKRPHRTKLYLIVDRPEPLFTARVDGSGQQRTSISFDGGAGEAQDVKKGMTLLVGSTPGGRELGTFRVRALSGTVSGTITINETAPTWYDDAYLTILPEFRLWSVFPRITNTYINKKWVLDWFKDYNIDYDTNVYRKQGVWLPPVAIMGPPAVAFLDDESVTIKFVGENSYTICPNGIKINHVEQGDVSVSPTCAWEFQNAVPTAATTLGTRDDPHVVTWSQAGRFLTSLTVKNDKPAGYEKTTTTYRPVFILNRPGTAGGINEPYEHFQLVSCHGNFDSGGCEARIRVFGDADINEFPDGAMIILFAEEWYGETKQSIGGYPYRENVKLVAWITDENVQQGWSADGERYVEFTVKTINGLMKEIEAFPTTIEDRPSLATGNTEANEWWQMFKLQVNRAAFYLLYWHTTLILMTDVTIVQDNSRLAAQDFPAGSLYRQIDDYAGGAVLGRCLSDRQSCLFIEKNIQTEPGAEARAARPTILVLDKNRHLDKSFEATRAQMGRVRYLEGSGVTWNGNVATAYISQVPQTPAQEGVDEEIKGLVVESQAELNAITGYAFAAKNNPWPDVPLKFQGNHSYLDIAPQAWLELSLDAQDTKRGIEWSNKKLVPRRWEWEYDPELQLLRVNIHAEAEATGETGITGDYVVPADIPKIPGVPPTVRLGTLYVGTDDGLYNRSPKEGVWSLLTDRRSPFDDVEPLIINAIELAPAQASTAISDLLIGTNQGLFRGTFDLSRRVFNWTKYTISDPPNTWSDDPPLAASDLDYTHVRMDETDLTGNTFWIVGTKYERDFDNPGIRTWLGKTTNKGSDWTWYPAWDPVYGLPFLPESLDIDKEDGSRVFFTGRVLTGEESDSETGLLIFDASDGSLTKSFISGRDPFIAEKLRVYCPYLPSGTSADGDYFILYGMSLGTLAPLEEPLWSNTVLRHMLYSKDLGTTFYELVDEATIPGGDEHPLNVGLVDIFPRDEKEFCAVLGPRYLFGMPGEHYTISAQGVKWYSGPLTTAADEIPNYQFYSFYDGNYERVWSVRGYSDGCRHRRDPNMLIMHGVNQEGNWDLGTRNAVTIIFTTDRGKTWTDITDNLRSDNLVRVSAIDWRMPL